MLWASSQMSTECQGLPYALKDDRGHLTRWDFVIQSNDARTPYCGSATSAHLPGLALYDRARRAQLWAVAIRTGACRSSARHVVRRAVVDAVGTAVCSAMCGAGCRFCGIKDCDS